MADSGVPSTAIDWEDPSSLPVDAVQGLFLTLSKALRSYQLYDRSNPVFLRFVTSLREAFQRIWETRDELQIIVEEDRFLWMGEEVYREETRSGSLSFLVYRDGIRDLTFRRGVEGDELDAILDVLHRVRSARQEEDDLVTLLWDLELEHLDYTAVDLLPEGTLLRAGPEDPSSVDARRILESELGESGDPDAAEAASASTVLDEIASIRTEDFNPTLYALDAGERAYLEEEYRKEIERDIRADVLSALFDRLEDEKAESERQDEIVGAFRQLLPTFLGRGHLRDAARLLRELEATRSRLEDRLSPGALREADALLEEFSAPESVRELVRAVEEGQAEPVGDDLALLLRHLRPGALGPLLAEVERLGRPEAQRTVREAIEKLARGEEARVVRFLNHADPTVVAGAVRLMGALRHRSAAPRLAQLVDHEDAEVRRAVLDAARKIPTTQLAETLEGQLTGPDREVRMGAARVLGEIQFTPAVPTFREILEGKVLREADVAEKMAFFTAFADLAGEDAIALLDRILNHRSLLGRREPPELRACAALALGRVGGSRAVKAIRRAEADDEPAVRSAVRRVLGEAGGEGVRA